MKRIVVSVSNDLMTDQRVSKICRTLKEMDYDILLIGRKNNASSSLKRDYDIRRMKMLFQRGFLFYAEWNIRLFFLLLFLKKDLLFSNDLDTLLPNYLVSKIQGKELIFDSHELFSEVPELQHRQFVKSVWLGMENYLMPKLKKVITVSDSIKSYYEKRYGILVTVVRNLPEPKAVKTKKFPFSTHGKKVLLYQGSVNMGRGLELMIQTMKHLEDYLLVIIGSGDIMEQLEQNVLQNNLENKVKFMGKVSPKELHKLTPNASIGLSLEEDLGLNYRYALPNKIFDYIQAEVPVIVSALPEMEKLVTSVQAGTILRQRSPEDLAKLIQNFSPEMYTDALKKAKNELVWTKEKIALEKLVKA